MANSGLRLVGNRIRLARERVGLTVSDLALAAGLDESALQGAEDGLVDVGIESAMRIGELLADDVLSNEMTRSTNLKIVGGAKLMGSVAVRSSKNGSLAVLAASLLNKGTTTIRGIAKNIEVGRILQVLESVGVTVRWTNEGNDVVLERPDRLDLASIDVEAAKLTRSIVMLLGPLLHEDREFRLPHPGGCDLGTRTVEPHMAALRHFGLETLVGNDFYNCHVEPGRLSGDRTIVLVERGDTVTENAIMAAARSSGVTTIRNASANYMVQDVCYFVAELGVKIDGIGTTTLTIRGSEHIERDVSYCLSEDPIEAMTLLTAAIVTSSEITISRVPIEFLEVELELLTLMGLKHERSPEYLADNGATRLVDITTFGSSLTAPIDKIHPMPFPGINIDNLPFFVLIAATAAGQTIVHDWVYDNRAIYMVDLSKLGCVVKLLDPHRILVEGPATWKPAEVMCPPALRPAVVILLAMLATPGVSLLRNTFIIKRGYEDLPSRLAALGAQILET